MLLLHKKTLTISQRNIPKESGKPLKSNSGDPLVCLAMHRSTFMTG